MARWADRPRPVPEQLCRFVPADWPAAGCIHDALGEWKAAALVGSGVPG